MTQLDIFNQARLEISCDLADEILKMIMGEKDICIESNEETVYTIEAQDKFDELQSLIEEAMISFAKKMVQNNVGLDILTNK